MISHSWNILRIYATGDRSTFVSLRCDIKEVWLSSRINQIKLNSLILGWGSGGCELPVVLIHEVGVKNVCPGSGMPGR